MSALVEFGDEARVIAGGQSLGPLMALRLAAPAVLVDLARVPGLDAIAVGARRRDPARRDGAPTVRRAPPGRRRRRRARRRGRAVHRARRDPQPGHGLRQPRPRRSGRRAPCGRARARRAQVHVRGEHGARTVGADDFFTGYYSTAVEPDELVEAVTFPPSPPRTGTAFVEFSRRHGDFALVGVAAVVTLAGDGTIAAARLAVSGVASTPFRPACRRIAAHRRRADSRRDLGRERGAARRDRAGQRPPRDRPPTAAIWPASSPGARSRRAADRAAEAR